MRKRFALMCFLCCLFIGNTASADVTGFVGANQTPSTRTVRGLALSFSLFFVGLEFEFSDTQENLKENAPGLRTGMFNLEFQSPQITRLVFYGTLGGGIYQERLSEHRTTNFGSNLGGGVKIPLGGPLGLRIDHRIFLLQGTPLIKRPQRTYLGLNLEV